ncbi:AraC family transcriptional regulator [Paraclostridium ghonii]|uniref:AraC family transcriptional regulator n=1 Tax=Paraclostridium ghonii TaxID=29358 RepID=UPI0035234CB1
MFDKATSPKFKIFGEIMDDSNIFNNCNIYSFKNKNISNLNFLPNSQICIKVLSGVVMILVSSNHNNLNSFIVNRPIKLKKGIYFNLISISDKSTIYISNSISKSNSISLKHDYIYSAISSSLHIKEIYTKFYQEKGYNYIFKGESHPYWELTYVDKGVLNTDIDKNSYTLKQGDLIFYAPLQFHNQYTLKENTCSYLTMNFNMDFNDYEFLCNKVFTLNRDSHNIIQNLINELSTEDIYSDDLSLCYLKQLIINTLRFKNLHTQHKPTTYMQQTYENNLLNDILKYIYKNINKKISIDTICNEFCISSTTLHSLFKKNMRTTVKSYINDIKLSKSKELIKSSSYTFSQISEILGFSSIHYFSRKFKSHFGISPTEYSKSIYK